MNDSGQQFGATLRRLGWLNGLLIGLALAVGVWLPQIITLVKIPTTPIPYASIAIAALAVIIISTLTGLLSALMQKGWATVLLWLGAGLLISLPIGYQPYRLQTFLVWLARPELYGLPLYPAPVWKTASIVLGSFFILLVLTVLALLQGYRLESIEGEHHPDGRLTSVAWSRLLLPLPLLVGAGLITSNVYGSHTTPQALQLVHDAISVALTYEGDLFQLGQARGVNYAALNGVREQLSNDYTLTVVANDVEIETTVVAAHFDNGAWIYCRLIADQLNYCYDASPPYTTGFSSLVRGEEVPETCNDCLPAAHDRWLDWLAQQRAALGSNFHIERVEQWGSHVLMRATSGDGVLVVHCWFQGLQPVEIRTCREARS